MQQTITNLPGYRVNNYLLVLDPHEELRNKITGIKKEFHDVYKVPMAVSSKPSLGLASFTQLEMMEEKIINRLKNIAMGYFPFKVELKDFGSFPSHTIYINVTTKEPIRDLIRQIKPWQRVLKLDADNKPHFFEEPHLTIARKLVPWQYEKGWLEYSHRHFTGRFIADSMLLLKKREGEKFYQVAERLQFQNLPITTKQGELFF